MKCIFFLLAALFTFCASYSFAAFPVKHTSAADHRIIASYRTDNTTESRLAGKNHSQAIRLSDWLHQKSSGFFPVRRKSDVHGILSLIFGIIGVIPVFGLWFCV